ncbi:hypothetical protein FDH34_gp066 [Serratia phage BF]|uniref:Uncharacterized protein n=1 Tax=Serratia phage BF TaxID=1962671 RepID=A0A1S6UA48_9CAUD|nr:hypothetical protein FDH34_gp066 [Serratia phage BF]AQW88591.1 hypothetical protein BF_0066 [Serratia phage BF]
MSSLMTKTFAKYLRLGITPRPVRGNWKDGDYMYSIYHGDVQYAIDDTGDYEIDHDVDYILDCLQSRATIIDRNHKLISEIYEHLMGVLDTDIWVRVGVGMQLNVVFGSVDGEIATFMMDFEDMEAFNKLVEEIKAQILEETNKEPIVEQSDYFTLILHNRVDIKLFKGYYNPKVRIHFMDEFEDDDGDDDEED